MTTFLLKTTKAYFSSYSGLDKIAWAGFALCFFESFFIAIYYFLPIYFTESLKLSILNIGFVISFFGIGTILGGYLGGRLSDRYNPHIVCTGSLFAQCLVFFLFISASSQLQLSIILFFLGLFSYMFLTSNYLVILNQCGYENEKLKAINIINVVSNLSLALSSFLFGFLNSKHFSIFFQIGGIALFLLGIFSLFLPIYKKEFDTKKIYSNENNSYSDITVLNHKKVLFITFSCTFLMGFIIFQTNTTYSTYIRAAFPQFDMQALSILLILNCLMVVFLQTPIGNNLASYNKLFLMGLGAFLIGFGMVILILCYDFSIAIISCILYTLGEIIFCSISQLLCYEVGHNKAKTIGTYRAIYASTRFIAPSIGGLIFYYFGGNLLWIFCGVLGLLCLIVCQFFGGLLSN